MLTPTEIEAREGKLNELLDKDDWYDSAEFTYAGKVMSMCFSEHRIDGSCRAKIICTYTPRRNGCNVPVVSVAGKSVQDAARKAIREFVRLQRYEMKRVLDSRQKRTASKKLAAV